MSNDYSGNPIILDTFSSAIDLAALTGKHVFAIESIEWQNPVTANDVCAVLDDAGRPLLDTKCVVAGDSKIKYWGGTHFSNIKIAQSAVSSGKVIIALRVNRRM
jgi:hypothetical protein